MADYQSEEYLIELLLIRLERITADSTLAHKASGIRGALIRQLDAFRFGKPVDSARLKQLIDSGFDIVKSAASK